jgi:hypothetical protein
MAEIKSTLELAMERSKKFTISEKEKEEIKQKEVLQKATGLFHRYREGHLPLTEMLREIERMDEKPASTVREFLLDRWIDALSFNAEEERLFRGIEVLKGKEIVRVKEKFHRLLSQFQKEREKIKEEVRVQLTEVLRKENIYGTAVDPKLEGSEIWKKENEKLDHSYRMKLEEIKEQLRSL